MTGEQGCPANLGLCGVPCGCNGNNPSHRAQADYAAELASAAQPETLPFREALTAGRAHETRNPGHHVALVRWISHLQLDLVCRDCPDLTINVQARAVKGTTP